MIHDLDIIASLVASPVAEVRAIGMPIITNEIDMASARIEFQNGTVAEISAGRASLEPSRKIRFVTPSATSRSITGRKTSKSSNVI